MKVTVFKNLFDNKTDKQIVFTEWKKFSEFLFNVSQMPGAKYDKENPNKQSTPLISPAVYKPNSTRSNKNVTHWAGWAAIDVDEYDIVNSLEEDINAKCGQYTYVCYSTASSTVEKPKFRIVFPFEQDLPADKIKHFWYALNTELDFIGDKQTKDLSRMYYAPAEYENAYNFIWQNDANMMNPYDIMSHTTYAEKSKKSIMDVLPKEMYEAIMKEKANSLYNTDIHWTSYRDCPFWPKSLADKYIDITEAGWYNTSYSILCAIAGNAIKAGYPITAQQIAVMFRQFDLENGNWYRSRPLETEASRALDWVFRNSL